MKVHINGQMSICERCGAQIFRKCVGDGETDGGYTRWNKFEPYPEGWANLPIYPFAENRQDGYLLLCPTCTREYTRLMTKYMAGYERRGGYENDAN